MKDQLIAHMAKAMGEKPRTAEKMPQHHYGEHRERRSQTEDKIGPHKAPKPRLRELFAAPRSLKTNGTGLFIIAQFFGKGKRNRFFSAEKTDLQRILKKKFMIKIVANNSEL